MNISRRSQIYTSLWFCACLILLFIQYGRPQNIIPVFGLIRPYFLIFVICLTFLVISGQNVIQLSHTQMKIMWASVILMLIMIPFSKNYGIGFFITRTILMTFPFILSILILVDTEKKLKKLVTFFVLIGLFNATYGLMLHDGEGRNAMFNLGNFLTDPNEFSLYMNMLIPFAYFLFLGEKVWNIKKIMFLGSTGVMVLAVIVSYSRGGLVGLMCIGIIMWMYSPNKKITVALAVVVTICIIVFSAETWKEAMSTTTDLEHSTISGRLNLWMGSLKMFVDNPIFGVGTGNAAVHMPDYAPEKSFHVSHSIWLTSLAENGIVGFALFVSLIWVNFKDSLRIRKTTTGEFLPYFGPACIGSMAGYLSSGTFLTVNYYPHFWYLSAIIAAGARVAMITDQKEI